MKRVLALALAAALLALPVIFGGGGMGKGPEGGATLSVMSNVKVVSSRGGEEAWSLSSERAEMAEGGNIIGLNVVSVQLPSRGLTVEADEGSYDTESDRLTLKGDVRTRIGGYVMRTGELDISTGGGDVESGGKVVLEGKGMRVEGNRLTGSNEGLLRLEGGVKAVFKGY